MDWQTETAAVIPCLNEVVTIGPLVAAVRQHVSAICVVDDGSRDGTATIAERAGAHVIRHEKPRGKGAALRTGWDWARHRGFTWAVTLDGDGQHLPADIPSLFRCAESTGAELAVGNRMGEAARMPFIRRVVNRWMSRRLARLMRRPVPDSQCGFRLLNLDALGRLCISAAHYEIESDVLLGFSRAGFRIAFVPISVIYQSERSKIRPIRDAVRWFAWWRLARSPALAPGAPVEIGGRPSVADA